MPLKVRHAPLKSASPSEESLPAPGAGVLDSDGREVCEVSTPSGDVRRRFDPRSLALHKHSATSSDTSAPETKEEPLSFATYQ